MVLAVALPEAVAVGVLQIPVPGPRLVVTAAAFPVVGAAVAVVVPAEAGNAGKHS